MSGYDLDEKSGLFGMMGIKSPQKVLKNGEEAELNHFSVYEQIKVTLTAVGEDKVIVKEAENFTSEGVSIGDYVVLTSGSSGDKIVLNGYISEIKSSSPFEASIKVNRIDKFKDLKKGEKYHASLKADLKIIGIADPKPGIVKSISLSSVKLDCKEDVLLEDIVEGTVRLNKLNKCNFKGKVVRKNKISDGFEYGIEIIELTESNSKALYSFIDKLINV